MTFRAADCLGEFIVNNSCEGDLKDFRVHRTKVTSLLQECIVPGTEYTNIQPKVFSIDMYILFLDRKRFLYFPKKVYGFGLS